MYACTFVPIDIFQYVRDRHDRPVADEPAARYTFAVCVALDGDDRHVVPYDVPDVMAKEKEREGKQQKKEQIPHTKKQRKMPAMIFLHPKSI